MAMMCGLILHIVTIMSLRFEVRGEMTADLVFSFLSDRFDQLAIQTYSSVAAINDRIDNIEQIIKSPLHSNTYSTEVQGKGDEMVDPENKKSNNRILKALAAEKIYVRNVLTGYEEKLIEFQRAVSDNMNVMNTTIEASREKMERKLEANTGNINKSVHQLMSHSERKLIEFQRAVSDKINVMNTTIEASREEMGRKLEENTGNINKSVHQLMTHSETKFQDVIKEFKTTMYNASIEHETTRSDLIEIQNTVKDIEDDINGGWSTWSSWSKCSTTCDVGIRSQSRACNNPEPSHNGRYCIGDPLRVDTCNIDQDCSKPTIDGGWSSWSSWSKCSTTCGVGKRSQSRACNNPVPSLNGQNCIGDPSHVDTCTIDQDCSKPTIEYSDCSEIKLHEPNAEDGVYGVVLWKTNRTFQVYCDMTTDGGGWTVFQNRYDGSVDFYRNYSQYVQGFGDLHTEFWLGLDFIQEMSSQTVNELRIDLMAANGTTAYEVFSPFSLSPSGYVLNVGRTTSSNNINLDIARFRFGPHHNGYAFTTYDHDVDSYSSNCASTFHGAWWYNICYTANLNGQYLNDAKGMTYNSFLTYHSLKQSKMSFRRKWT